LTSAGITFTASNDEHRNLEIAERHRELCKLNVTAARMFLCSWFARLLGWADHIALMREMLNVEYIHCFSCEAENKKHIWHIKEDYSKWGGGGGNVSELDSDGENRLRWGAFVNPVKKFGALERREFLGYLVKYCSPGTWSFT
jgi:hypothetical protein